MRLCVALAVACAVLLPCSLYAQRVPIVVTTIVPHADSTGEILLSSEGDTTSPVLVEHQLKAKLECMVNDRSCCGELPAYRIDSIATTYGAEGFLVSARMVYSASVAAVMDTARAVKVIFIGPSDEVWEYQGKKITSVAEELALVRRLVHVVSEKKTHWGVYEVIYRNKKR